MAVVIKLGLVAIASPHTPGRHTDPTTLQYAPPRGTPTRYLASNNSAGFVHTSRWPLQRRPVLYTTNDGKSQQTVRLRQCSGLCELGSTDNSCSITISSALIWEAIIIAAKLRATDQSAPIHQGPTVQATPRNRQGHTRTRIPRVRERAKEKESAVERERENE